MVGVAGSNPAYRSNADVAQLAAHRFPIPRVVGSSPIIRSNLKQSFKSWYSLAMSTHLERYRDLLGMPLGQANFRLWKKAVWSLLEDLGRTACMRCGKPMSEQTYSIDHKEVWRGVSADLFWDMGNIGWSHHACNYEAARKVTPNPQPRRRVIIDGKLTCTTCHETKPVEEFGKAKKAWNGLSAYCLPCARARTAAAKASRGADVPPERHGRVATYEAFGCRCAPCRAAASEYRKNVNADRKNRNTPV